MASLASVVDTDALLKTIWLGFVAGVGISAFFAIAVLGLIRADDARQAV